MNLLDVITTALANGKPEAFKLVRRILERQRITTLTNAEVDLLFKLWIEGIEA